MKATYKKIIALALLFAMIMHMPAYAKKKTFKENFISLFAYVVNSGVSGDSGEMIVGEASNGGDFAKNTECLVGREYKYKVTYKNFDTSQKDKKILYFQLPRQVLAAMQKEKDNSLTAPEAYMPTIQKIAVYGVSDPEKIKYYYSDSYIRFLKDKDPLTQQSDDWSLGIKADVYGKQNLTALAFDLSKTSASSKDIAFEITFAVPETDIALPKGSGLYHSALSYSVEGGDFICRQTDYSFVRLKHNGFANVSNSAKDNPAVEVYAKNAISREGGDDWYAQTDVIPGSSYHYKVFYDEALSIGEPRTLYIYFPYQNYVANLSDPDSGMVPLPYQPVFSGHEIEGFSDSDKIKFYYTNAYIEDTSRIQSPPGGWIQTDVASLYGAKDITALQIDYDPSGIAGNEVAFIFSFDIPTEEDAKVQPVYDTFVSHYFYEKKPNGVLYGEKGMVKAKLVAVNISENISAVAGQATEAEFFKKEATKTDTKEEVTPLSKNKESSKSRMRSGSEQISGTNEAPVHSLRMLSDNGEDFDLQPKSVGGANGKHVPKTSGYRALDFDLISFICLAGCVGSFMLWDTLKR